MDDVERVLVQQLEHHLDRRLKSLQFLHEMKSFASSPLAGRPGGDDQ